MLAILLSPPMIAIMMVNVPDVKILRNDACTLIQLLTGFVFGYWAGWGANYVAARI